MEKQFNVRVYGILRNDQGEILLSDERFSGSEFTKFPGGGLEMGEGTIECLKREFIEELNLTIEVVKHYYTTDFYLASAFDSNQQLLSIYYLVKAQDLSSIKASRIPFDFDNPKALKGESHRWLRIMDLDETIFRWPVDKHVCRMLINDFEVRGHLS